MIIRTSPQYPPIPVRDLDWQAYVDGYEPGDALGQGATEQDAIDDLLAAMDLPHDAATQSAKLLPTRAEMRQGAQMATGNEMLKNAELKRQANE